MRGVPMSSVQGSASSRSRRAIIASFLDLLSKYPFEKISIQSILDQCGYSRGTFYSQFADKTDLLNQIMTDEVDCCIQFTTGYIQPYKETYRQQKNEVKQAEDIKKHILGVVSAYFHHVYDNRLLFQLLYDNRLPGHSMTTFAKEVYLEQREHFQLKPSGPYKDINTDMYTYQSAYKIILFMTYWIENDFKYSPQYMADQVVMITEPNFSVFSNLLAE